MLHSCTQEERPKEEEERREEETKEEEGAAAGKLTSQWQHRQANWQANRSIAWTDAKRLKAEKQAN